MKKGIIVLLVLSLFSFCAFGATYDFYGSIGVEMFGDNSTGGNDDYDMNYNIINGYETVLGAKIGINNKLSAHIEYSAGGVTQLIYSTYDAGAYMLTMGFASVPYNITYDKQAFTKGAATPVAINGAPYIGRATMLQGEMNGVKVALINSATLADNLIPQLQIGYDAKISNIEIKTAAMYDNKGTATEATYGVALGASTKIAGLMIGGTLDARKAAAGANLGDYFGATVIVEYKLNKMMCVGAGFGSLSLTKTTAATSDWYINLPMQIESNFTITPEIGSLAQNKLYAGIKTKVSFL